MGKDWSPDRTLIFGTLYLLMGLYAVTPILRVLVKHLNRKLFTYLLLLWFAGTVTTPFIHTFTDFNFQPVVFVFFDWVGYFLLGIYLLNSSIRRKTAYAAAALGLLGVILGDWLLTATAGEQFTGTFHNYMSATMIVGTAAVFFLLTTTKPTRLESHATASRFIRWVSQNTLLIYLIHIIVIETLTFGFFGVYLNTLTYLPLIDIPVFAFIVFGVSAALVYGLKKIPYVKKLIG